MNGNPPAGPDAQGRRRLGMVVAGSLTDGMEVRLDAATTVEEIKVGTYVTIQGERMRFFGVLTDVSLGSTDPSLKMTPPDVSNPYIARVERTRSRLMSRPTLMTAFFR